MASLSLSQAWDDTRAVFARDGKLIAAVALALFYLPAVVVGVVMPREEGLPSSGVQLVFAGTIAFIGLVGQLAIARLALGKQTSVGEAIGEGARRAPAYFAASMIWLLPAGLAIFLVSGRALQSPESATVGQALFALVMVCLLLFIAVRMLATSPVAAAESVGPIDILRRSWALTRGHWWRLFGFLLSFLLVALAALTAAGLLAGLLSNLILGDPKPMTLAALVYAMLVELVTTVVTAGFVVMLARIYLQLAGHGNASASVPRSGH